MTEEIVSKMTGFPTHDLDLSGRMKKDGKAIK